MHHYKNLTSRSCYKHTRAVQKFSFHSTANFIVSFTHLKFSATIKLRRFFAKITLNYYCMFLLNKVIITFIRSFLNWRYRKKFSNKIIGDIDAYIITYQFKYLAVNRINVFFLNICTILLIETSFQTFVRGQHFFEWEQKLILILL